MNRLVHKRKKEGEWAERRRAFEQEQENYFGRYISID